MNKTKDNTPFEMPKMYLDEKFRPVKDRKDAKHIQELVYEDGNFMLRTRHMID